MAKERIPYFRFYPSDFMRGIRGMTAQEVGLYMMLLCRMYEESGPIEDHTLRLATYCGMRQSTFEKTLQKLVDLGKIERESGTLFNDRARIEISHRANDLKVAIKAGKASAEKRQQKQQKAATPVEPPFNHTDTDTDTGDTDVSPTRNALESEFDEFWSFVPHKIGKESAFKVFSDLSPQDRISARQSVNEWYSWFRRIYPTASPTHPATYLNGKRWQDEGWQPKAGISDHDRMRLAAKPIVEGKAFLCTQVSAASARKMIDAGLVTRDQCRAVNINI